MFRRVRKAKIRSQYTLYRIAPWFRAHAGAEDDRGENAFSSPVSSSGSTFYQLPIVCGIADKLYFYTFCATSDDDVSSSATSAEPPPAGAAGGEARGEARGEPAAKDCFAAPAHRRCGGAACEAAGRLKVRPRVESGCPPMGCHMTRKSGGGLGKTCEPKVRQIQTNSPGVGHMDQSTVSCSTPDARGSRYLGRTAPWRVGIADVAGAYTSTPHTIGAAGWLFALRVVSRESLRQLLLQRWRSEISCASAIGVANTYLEAVEGTAASAIQLTRRTALYDLQSYRFTGY
eukprot:gene21156-biopygen5644